jgi:hypothetical protein
MKCILKILIKIANSNIVENERPKPCPGPAGPSTAAIVQPTGPLVFGKHTIA